MAVVVLQLGQAGNQLGAALFNRLAAQAERDLQLRHRFFRPAGPDGRLIARAVAVDTESKVINSILQTGRQWRYNERNAFCGERGAGNNWADGYVNHGEATATEVLNMLRREVDAAESLEAFLILSSVAGGTGSGLGTRLTEHVRDAYSTATILNVVIWPFSSGEVILQNYNAVLSLAHLYPVSDGVMLFENDRIQKVCQTALKLKIVKVDHLNKVIADHLGMLLATSRQADLGSGRAVSPLTTTLQDLLEHLCPHPQYKLLQTIAAPQMPEDHQAFTSYRWDALLRTLRAMHAAASPCEEGFNWRLKVPETPSLGAVLADEDPHGAQHERINTSLATQVFLRGSGLSEARTDEFLTPGLYTAWSPQPLRVSSSDIKFAAQDKSAALVSNCRSLATPVDTVAGRAWDTFCARAYLHQYSRFGLAEDDFSDAFIRVEQIVKDYQGL